MTKTARTEHATIRLFADGMSPLHRAGLGGLACTLRAMERLYDSGLLPESQLPAPFASGTSPWTIEADEITLWFGKPECAGEYFKRLFEFAFQLKDGLIYLPGQYPDPPPSIAVRAEMQTALTRALLQGAKKNIALDRPIPFSVDPNGDGAGTVEIEFQRCTAYLHQQLWPAFIDEASKTLLNAPKRRIGTKNVNFGSLYPGAIKRHDVLNESELSETTHRMLCCIFFLVGCASARMTKSGDGILLVPEVSNLEDFVIDRPAMTPLTVSEVRVGSAADAAYQAEIRLRTRCLLTLATSVPSCFAQRFAIRTWTKPQKSRIDSVQVLTEGVTRVEPANISAAEKTFRQFERALALLPRGVRVRNDESFYWTDSIVRPFIADNLASRRPWYSGFAVLARTPQKRKLLSYERKGLNDMIHDDDMWECDGEKIVVRSIHGALLALRGRISAIYSDRPQLMYQKFDDEREKYGRIFAGNMTAAQFRKSLAEMFRRAGSNPELQANWDRLLPMLRRESWEHARDLALIGLCSYQGRGDTNSSRSMKKLMEGVEQ